MNLPNTIGNAPNYNMFPLLPYSEVAKATSGFGSKASYVEAFEFQLLNPTRQKVIEAMLCSNTTTGNNTSYALTPQGYQATFNNGKWTGISVAKADVTAISIHSITKATNTNPIVITSTCSPATGTIVVISGVQGNSAANGTWTITKSSSTTFSLNGSNGSGAYTSGGKWSQLVSSVDIKFSGTVNAPLTDALQKAFLTNQQFLVMTANVNGNLDGFNASIMMSDWSFGSQSGTAGSLPILNMPAATTPGNYTNVFIFKSGNTAIKQMAKNPDLWTQYKDFNDTKSDPEGHFLSSWLVNYLEEAESLYDNGVTSLENFCNLINDKNWNGLLALKVKVGDIATLPVDVQALVADISSNLYAHHLGNEINHVSLATFADIEQGASAQTSDDGFPDNTTVSGKTENTITLSHKPTSKIPEGTNIKFVKSIKEINLKLNSALPTSKNIINKSEVSSMSGSYNLNSPFFGLIHYVNPHFAGEVKNPPAYVQSANDYDFTVLTLEVVFEKVLETHFANKSMLLINKFFGDKVQQTGPAGEQGANNLILIGTYHHVDNVPSYSFSTAKGVTTDFYLASNAFNCIRISNVTMNVAKLSGSSESTDVYKASFAIRGSFNFLNDSNFDLLSYEYLPYYGLTMDVTIHHGKPNVYHMDSSKLQFEKNQTEALAAGSGQQAGQALNIVRTGSLVEQFPMKLKGLVRHVDTIPITFAAIKEGASVQTDAKDFPDGTKVSSTTGTLITLSNNPTSDILKDTSIKFKNSNQEEIDLKLSLELTTLDSTINKSEINHINLHHVSPGDMGYRLLETATPKGISFTSPSNGAAWYGLEFDVILGGKGSLAASGAISASIILSWTPGGNGVANASPQFKLSGPDGVSLSFDFEGVLKFGAKDIMLNRYVDTSHQTNDYFYLDFQSIALTLLDISFPPGGTTNLVLMGDTDITAGETVKPTLAWFGGYAKGGS